MGLSRAQGGAPGLTRVLDVLWQMGGTATGVAPDTAMVPMLGFAATPTVQVLGGVTTLETANSGVLARMANAAGSLITPTLATYALMFRGKLLSGGNGPQDLEMDPIYRVRWRVRRTQNGANRGGQGMGFGLMAAAAALGTVPGVGTGAGISINMNAALTGWELFLRRQVAGATVQVPLSWPTDTVFTTWEMRVIPAGPVASAQPASLIVLRDNVPQLTRLWSTGDMPDYTGAGALYRLVPAIYNQLAAATDFLDIQSLRITAEAQVD